MDLTPEEMNKIREEEKIKMEFRQQVGSEEMEKINAEKAKKNNKAIVIGIVIFFVIIIIIAIASSSAPKNSYRVNTSKGSSNKNTLAKSKLEVVEYSWRSGRYWSSIAGTVKNNTNTQYSHVQVEINLYDNNGAKVGSTMATTDNLDPGGVWKFDAPVMEAKATGYKIVSVTGY